VEVPVVVNGDIVDLAAAREALRESGAAAVMVGRGAQGRPWIVGQIAASLVGRAPAAAPAGRALGALVAEHYDAILTESGTEIGVRVARKHLGWYLEAAGIVPPDQVRTRLLTSASPAEVLELVDTLFDDGWRDAA
jgi:tRNA-dihydrouridine synthase B